jgi:hypothetical protein
MTSIALAVVITLQVLSSWYIGVLILLAVGIFFVWQAVLLLGAGLPRAASPRAAPPLAPGRRAMQLALIVILCSAAIWPFATPYLRGTLDSAPMEIRENSARVSDYVLPPAHTWGGRVAAAAGAYGLNLPYGERAVFVGYVALAAAVLAIGVLTGPRAGREPAGPDRRSELWCLVSIAALAFVCSLGPAAIAGRGPGAAGAASVADWTPFGLISHLPGLSLFRAPARFALLVMLAVSVLAAYAARWWQDRWGSAGRVLTALLIPVAVSESFLIGSPVGRPQPAPIPPMYAHLATLAPGPVVSLPAYREPHWWWLRANYQYYSTAHWFPIVNGYSRVDPPDHGWIAGHMAAFPGVNSANTMRRIGVRYVVLHADRYPDGAAEILGIARSSPDFALLHRIGETYLFQVAPGEALARGEAPADGGAW